MIVASMSGKPTGNRSTITGRFLSSASAAPSSVAGSPAMRLENRRNPAVGDDPGHNRVHGFVNHINHLLLNRPRPRWRTSSGHILDCLVEGQARRGVPDVRHRSSQTRRRPHSSQGAQESTGTPVHNVVPHGRLVVVGRMASEQRQ